MAQNLIEKITQKFCLDLPQGAKVHSADFVTLRPAHVMTHDNTAAVIPKFKNIGAKKMADARQIVFTLDHNVQDKSEKNLAKYKNIENFAREMGIDFYPAGRGIGHQIMCEEGYVWPGSFVVASDSHSNMYGGLGCLGTPVVRSDAAALWATSKTWWQIPPVIKIELKGKLANGVSGKDVIIALSGYFNHDEALNHALEISGPGVATLSVDQRLTIANMSTEWGALVALFPTDDRTLDWLERRAAKLNSKTRHARINPERIAELKENIPTADTDAFYHKKITLDLSSITPAVAGPNSVKIMHSATELAGRGIAIQKAYLVSCVNSRVEDIAAAAAVIAGKKVANGVEFYIAPASQEVQQESEQRGDWQKLLAAGAIPLPAGCGPCIGLGAGLLKSGEVGISATNRNFKGRMGAPDAQAYLASPAIVAASAIAGKISNPFDDDEKPVAARLEPFNAPIRPATIRMISGFPATVNGRALFCPADNINTDGIYAGKYTYREDMTPEMMSAVVMENYDPSFRETAKSGDILLCGFNFGTGSSREQAATALKAFGIRMVVAGSFSQTYKRNAINNGFILLECPELIQKLQNDFGMDFLTRVIAPAIGVFMSESTIQFGEKSFPFTPLGQVAQQLIVANGLENWVQNELK